MLHKHKSQSFRFTFNMLKIEQIILLIVLTLFFPQIYIEMSDSAAVARVVEKVFFLDDLTEDENWFVFLIRS